MDDRVTTYAREWKRIIDDPNGSQETLSAYWDSIPEELVDVVMDRLSELYPLPPSPPINRDRLYGNLVQSGIEPRQAWIMVCISDMNEDARQEWLSMSENQKQGWYEQTEAERPKLRVVS